MRALELDERKGLLPAQAAQKASLIHHYNRHGQLIVASAGAVANARPTPNEETRHTRQYHTELLAASELPDLRADAPPTYNRLAITQDSERLYHETTASGAAGNNKASTEAAAADRMHSALSFQSEVDGWSGAAARPAQQRLNELWTGAHNARIVYAVSAESKGVHRAQSAKFAAGDSERVVFGTASGERDLKIPKEFAAELKTHVLYGQELLRHFWQCIPPTPA